MRRSSILFGVVALVLGTVLVSYALESSTWGQIKSTFNSKPASRLAKVGRGEIWADCELFGTVAMPALSKPGTGPFDELYAVVVDAQGNPTRLISESKPGDQDYNGGRWHVNIPASDLGDKYAGACKVEDLTLSDFKSTDIYFECPLLPKTRE